MSSAIIFLDESGDLGWSFGHGYRKGGSSRFLTIAAVFVPAEKKHIPKRVIRALYNRFKWRTGIERKWPDLRSEEREYFAQKARQMSDAHPDIHMHAVVVRKENVLAHIRRDPKKLYNYMIKLSLLDRMATCDVITLVPDPRSITGENCNSLQGYLQTELWFTRKAGTNLISAPMVSKFNRGIQVADLLGGIVQARFEDNDVNAFRHIANRINLSRLYF